MCTACSSSSSSSSSCDECQCIQLAPWLPVHYAPPEYHVRAAATSPEAQPTATDHRANLHANLYANVVINASLAGLSDRLQLRKNVPLAVDRAIAEIIFPTVERSVTIARMTTIELINKVDCARVPFTLIAAAMILLGGGCVTDATVMSCMFRGALLCESLFKDPAPA